MTTTADPAAPAAVALPLLPAESPVGYAIEPGNHRVDAVAVMPLDQGVTELDAVVRDLRRRGWTPAPQQYSRLMGSHHHVGLTRLHG